MPKRPKIPLLIPYGRGEVADLRHFSRYTFGISIEFRGIVWAAKRHLFCEVILKCTTRRVVSKNAEEAKNPSAHPLSEGGSRRPSPFFAIYLRDLDRILRDSRGLQNTTLFVR